MTPLLETDRPTSLSQGRLNVINDRGEAARATNHLPNNILV